MVDGTLPGQRTQPLRTRDPRALGDYELIGRLGEGGMGTVYLGRTAGGVLVAVKMVRADLAHDDEFRRRFRSEVNRARQVPPFCTAEVLDADPDHESPYLVVEFVDGPTLAGVVEKNGPLTTANLHGVAIGVATALTAIHGAGVIHRDLKPRNVLLAPGSPKVIDFGIARAMHATSGSNTRPDQMVGTVAYMAPERFGAEDVPITPAADVFAWGSVVAYAGTGSTPFHADSPPALAARILTQEPRLDGLSGTLRELVGHALEKDPANRPSARELLDLLISGERPAATAAAFADQPDLRAAAVEAQAVTGHAPVPVPGDTTGTPAGPADPVGSVGPVGSAGPAVAGDVPRQRTGPAGTGDTPVLDIPPGLIGYDENAIVTVPISDAPAPYLMTPAITFPPPSPPRPPRNWALPLAVIVTALALVAGAFLVVLSTTADEEEPATETTPTAVATGPVLTDPLRQRLLWQPSESVTEGGSCSFDDGLVIRRKTEGTFRCKGPLDLMPDDLSAAVDIRLTTENSCAAMWFRYQDSRGYQVRFCQRNIYVGIHEAEGSVPILRTFPIADDPIRLGDTVTRMGFRVVGDSVELFRDDDQVGTVTLTDPSLQSGQLRLGVVSERDAPKKGPYEVVFSDLTVSPS
ncbi:serine/threonine protein kinase [Actinoplanes rectilineatus]|uniref:serine/threonine protein kinase n=1 Tax=Actinoplanes rectilineatus TaxID=113571 RepID=UPI0005F2C6D0|nr:serine/threonine-protein kinase [Actinoplanes rectilineatus]